MKKSLLTYDEWKCITSKEHTIKRVDTNFFHGYIGFIEIKEITEPQIWNFNGEDIVVCDKGIKWLTILPKDKFYCITVMMNEKEKIILWYIDMIASQGIEDNVPFFYDLYLDLVVYPDGEIITDDMDELEEALKNKDITEQQFKLAVDTKDELKKTMLADINSFIEYTKKCMDTIK